MIDSIIYIYIYYYLSFRLKAPASVCDAEKDLIQCDVGPLFTPMCL